MRFSWEKREYIEYVLAFGRSVSVYFKFVGFCSAGVGWVVDERRRGIALERALSRNGR